MSRANLAVLAITLASLGSAASTCVGQDRLVASTLSSDSTLSTLTSIDWLFDYDVYASEPQELAYFVRYYSRYGGSYVEKGPFSTYALAERYLRYHPPYHYGRAEIVQHLTELEFVFVQRFGTYPEAYDFAQILESLGLLTDIRRYSDIVIADEPILTADF